MSCAAFDNLIKSGKFTIKIISAKGPCLHRPETLHAVPIHILAEFQSEEGIVIDGDLAKQQPNGEDHA